MQRSALRTLMICSLEVLNNRQGIVFCRSPPLWAMGVDHALQTIAHRVGSYKDNKIGVLGTNKGHSNFIGPDK